MDGQRCCLRISMLAALIAVAGCALPHGDHHATSGLGIAQALNLMGGQINKSGKHPNLEPKPPLTRLAATSNLESSNAVIKKAAEIKHAEDLAPQKIKAVRYLASLGCGHCYDDQGAVTVGEALVAGLNDCTEKVRHATVKALYDRAKHMQGDAACASCNGSCCTQEIVDKLWELACGYRDDGCLVEPSERIRMLAAQTVNLCCPTRCEPYYATPEETSHDQTDDSATVEPASETDDSSDPTSPPNPLPAPLPETLPAPAPSPVPAAAPTGEKQAHLSTDSDAAQPTILPATFRADEADADAKPAVAEDNAKAESTDGRSDRVITISGRIESINRDRGTATVRFNRRYLVPPGATMTIHHRHQLGRVSTSGNVQVLDSLPGQATVRPIGPLSIQQIGLNDSAVMQGKRTSD